MGVERTQRGHAATAESDPFQTSAARFALTQTDVPKCDSLNGPSSAGEEAHDLRVSPMFLVNCPIWFELMWGA